MTPRPTAPSRRVAFLIERNVIQQRDLALGIQRYSEQVGHWSLELLRTHSTWFIELLDSYDGDGVIAPTFHPSLPAMAAAHRWSIVYAGAGLMQKQNVVRPDHDQLARDAIDHLATQGLRTVVIFWTEDEPGNALRCAAAADQAASRGMRIERFFEGPRTRRRGTWRLADQLRDVADLLRAWDEPIGLFAYDDIHAQRAIAASRLASRRIPEDVAIITISGDPDFCEMTRPPLSSVGWSAERLGYEAARRLDQLLDGHAPFDEPLLLPPDPVRARASTDLLKVRDPLVAEVIARMEARLDSQITIKRLLRDLPISRNTLEKRFRAILGHTAAEHLRQLRLDTAKRLLRDTNQPLVDIAVACGYADPAQLCRQIKSATGQTPTTWRRDA